MIQATGQNLQNSTELIKLYCGSHLKYHFAEGESMRELFQVREQVKNVYMRKERALIEKKERIFRGRDVTKYLCTSISLDDLKKKEPELLRVKDKAFKFMCTEESRLLHELREELSFYTN